ncbi:hypothetical protein ACLOJK_005126, partial [Asimina triloba]
TKEQHEHNEEDEDDSDEFVPKSNRIQDEFEHRENLTQEESLELRRSSRVHMPLSKYPPSDYIMLTKN